MLETLMYISVAEPRVSDTDIDAILYASVRNNQRDDITGALIFSGSIFAQILEGNPEQLDALMDKLETDPRHHGVSVIAREPVAHRRFAGWSMAYRSVSGTLAEELHNQLGWDAAVNDLLQNVPEDRSLRTLLAGISGIFEQKQPQWASSQF